MNNQPNAVRLLPIDISVSYPVGHRTFRAFELDRSNAGADEGMIAKKLKLALARQEFRGLHRDKALHSFCCHSTVVCWRPMVSIKQNGIGSIMLHDSNRIARRKCALCRIDNLCRFRIGRPRQAGGAASDQCTSAGDQQKHVFHGKLPERHVRPLIRPSAKEG